MTDYCRNCGEEIELDITNPLSWCETCYKEAEEKEEQTTLLPKRTERKTKPRYKVRKPHYHGHTK